MTEEDIELVKQIAIDAALLAANRIIERIASPLDRVNERIQDIAEDLEYGEFGIDPEEIDSTKRK